MTGSPVSSQSQNFRKLGHLTRGCSIAQPFLGPEAVSIRLVTVFK